MKERRSDALPEMLAIFRRPESDLLTGLPHFTSSNKGMAKAVRDAEIGRFGFPPEIY